MFSEGLISPESPRKGDLILNIFKVDKHESNSNGAANQSKLNVSGSQMKL